MCSKTECAGDQFRFIHKKNKTEQETEFINKPNQGSIFCSMFLP